jgi:hypothetical protein
VGYFVEFVDPVRQYLGRIDGLTDEDRTKILEEMIEELGEDADRFHALRPLKHESLYFHYDYAYVGQSLIYSFDFVVNASHREMGVMQVVYVEHTVQAIP